MRKLLDEPSRLQVVLHRLAEQEDVDYTFVDYIIARIEDQAFSHNPRTFQAERASIVPLESVCFMNVVNNMLDLSVASDDNSSTSLPWSTIVANQSRRMHFTCCQAISYNSHLKLLLVITPSLSCSFLWFFMSQQRFFMCNVLCNQLAPTPILMQLLLCLRKEIIHPKRGSVSKNQYNQQLAALLPLSEPFWFFL